MILAMTGDKDIAQHNELHQLQEVRLRLSQSKLGEALLASQTAQLEHDRQAAALQKASIAYAERVREFDQQQRLGGLKPAEVLGHLHHLRGMSEHLTMQKRLMARAAQVLDEKRAVVQRARSAVTKSEVKTESASKLARSTALALARRVASRST
jgi:hypothetical protein